MAKSASKRPETGDRPKKSHNGFLPVQKKAFDANLSALFASSLGPVERPPISRYQSVVEKHSAEDLSEEVEESSSEDEASDGSDEELSDAPAIDQGVGSDDDSTSENIESDNEASLARIQESILNGPQDRTKKRKRGNGQDDLEEAYMEKIAREEAKDDEKRKKKRRKEVKAEKAVEAEVDPAEEDAEESDDSFVIPKHETLVDANDNDQEVEKAARTVFLGNVSNEAMTSKSAEKTLRQHLASFIPDLADSKPPHKIESIRFRSTAFAGALPKRAAFAKKEVMDSTTKSTNAYVVYSTKVAAREAVKNLNGTVVLGRHLRVDSIAHPSKVDHRRCVFVGNLGFVDDESNVNKGDDDKKKKSKPPGDVEEGLWVQFAKAGKVESVRVIRDSKTRVGKGFAYVQFEDENAVEAALQFHDQKYPPLLPRKLRVVRAKAHKKKDKRPGPPAKSQNTQSKSGYNAKISEEQKSKQGRARAMLGKSAAFKSAESFVFEGHRASSKQGHSGLKLGGKKRKGPNGRKSRSNAWKQSGGKKS